MLLILQDALDKKQAEFAAIQTTCEEKDDIILDLNQSLSQISTDKEEIRTKLMQAEEKLGQANRELMTYNEIIQKLRKSQVV